MTITSTADLIQKLQDIEAENGGPAKVTHDGSSINKIDVDPADDDNPVRVDIW